ncbi:MAG: hypothetical protein LBB63_01255 [Holosporaceae bacterium]|jgi:predicted Zn-dependent peptidase|nr:hypothetical protein [Holosporaceae bacterium]
MTARFLLLALLFSFRVTFGQSPAAENGFQEYKLPNGVKVILLENFRLPVALVGIIFDVGSFDAPPNKNGVASIVAANIVNGEMHRRLKSLGVSYGVNPMKEYTEILAQMHPRRLEEFFAVICGNISEISVENLEILKKQMIVDGKLASHQLNHILENVVCANVGAKNANIAGGIFNEKSLSSITGDDVKRFFADRYRDCRLAVVVVGAVDGDTLKKIMGTTLCKLGRRKETSANVFQNRDFRDIHIKSKYVDRGVWYFYHIPQRDSAAASEEFLLLLNWRLFDFFLKHDRLIYDYDVRDVMNRGDRLLSVCLRPRMDVPMEKLQMAYDVFVHRLCKVAVSDEYLGKIAKLGYQEEQFARSNLSEVYANVRNALLNGRAADSIWRTEKNIENLKGGRLKSLAEKILGKGLAFKITTRYKSDK